MTLWLRRFLIVVVVLLGTSVAAHAQVTATGHILNPDGTPAKNAKACFSLQNFKPASPRVLATGTIVQTSTFCVPTSSTDGSFTTTLYPNYAIAPAQTFWRVDYMVGGIQQSSATYNVTTNPFNLDSAAPTTTFPPPNGFVNGAHQFDFAQSAPATTWAIHHAFGSKSVVFNCYDINNKFLIPDTVVETDLNTLTITFTSPQAGSCVVMSAGNAGAVTTSANAVITNPNTTQVINGAPLTLQAPLTALDANHLNAYNLNNLVFVDGVKYTTLNAALADPACSTGCTIDMRGNGSAAALALGNFDPGTHPVTLLLGPFTYSVGSITVESDFHLVGAGMGQNGVVNPTILQSNTSANVFVMPPQASQPVQHLLLEGFRLYGNPANHASQIGMNFFGSAAGGVWYSTFRNFCVGLCAGGATPFGGGTIVFDATTLGSPAAVHQFNDFHNVQGFRAPTGNALKLIGTIGQFTFDQCQFDGTAQTDGGTDVLLSSSTGTSGPYSITFNALTAQEGNVGVDIAGAQDITFIDSHHETVNGAYLLQVGTGPTNTSNINIIGSSCTNFCGNNAASPGTGYFVNDASPANVSVKMLGNSAPSPDNVLVGFPLGASVGSYMEIGTDSAIGGPMRPGTYTALFAAQRFGVIGATNLTTGAFSLGGNWGTSPSLTATAGTDSSFWLTFASGSGSPAANPTVTLTFADGAWAFPPNCIPARDDSAGGAGYWVQSLPGLQTSVTFTFIGTPAASTTYGLAAQCLAKQN